MSSTQTKTKIHLWTILIIVGFLFLASGTVVLGAYFPYFTASTTLKIVPCVLDTPPPPATPTPCSLCPGIEVVPPQACAGFQKIVMSPPLGKDKVQYSAKGDPAFKAGAPFIAGGSDNANPIEAASGI